MKFKIMISLFIIILLVGCTQNVYYTTPSQENSNKVVIQELPSLSSDEERIIIESWTGLNQFHSGTEGFISLLKNEWKLNVLKLYKGELIFRGQGYNYLFV